MVGMGFQEIISNILGSPQDLRDAMRLEGTEWGRLVEVDNVMSQNFSALRQWMLPSLLRVEAASNRAFYPHRMFEAGEVAPGLTLVYSTEKFAAAVRAARKALVNVMTPPLMV